MVCNIAISQTGYGDGDGETVKYALLWIYWKM